MKGAAGGLFAAAFVAAAGAGLAESAREPRLGDADWLLARWATSDPFDPAVLQCAAGPDQGTAVMRWLREHGRATSTRHSVWHQQNLDLARRVLDGEGAHPGRLTPALVANAAFCLDAAERAGWEGGWRAAPREPGPGAAYLSDHAQDPGNRDRLELLALADALPADVARRWSRGTLPVGSQRVVAARVGEDCTAGAGSLPRPPDDGFWHQPGAQAMAAWVALDASWHELVLPTDVDVGWFAWDDSVYVLVRFPGGVSCGELRPALASLSFDVSRGAADPIDLPRGDDGAVLVGVSDGRCYADRPGVTLRWASPAGVAEQVSMPGSSGSCVGPRVESWQDCTEQPRVWPTGSYVPEDVLRRAEAKKPTSPFTWDVDALFRDE